MWQRRQFLRMAGAGFAANLMPRQADALEAAELVFASAAQIGGDRYGAVLVTDRGEIVSRIPLPDRGHDVVFSPTTGEAVVFARQPGTFAIVFDPSRGREPVTIASRPDRHFFGHGTFSADGRLLYASENDFGNARGVVGVYDVGSGYARLGEFDSGGVGPHEVLLASDGRTMVVANGGIETHPGYGRAELNLATMDPSLAFIDVRDGALLGQLRLPADLRQNSIRHMAFDEAGGVWFGCQYRGPSQDQPQLVGRATLDGEMALVGLPQATLADLKNYVGSVAASRDGTLIGISSPEGDTVIVVEAASRKVIATQQLRDGCGLAPFGQGFLASSGMGELVGIGGAEVDKHGFDVLFDNHLRVVPALL